MSSRFGPLPPGTNSVSLPPYVVPLRPPPPPVFTNTSGQHSAVPSLVVNHNLPQVTIPPLCRQPYSPHIPIAGTPLNQTCSGPPLIPPLPPMEETWKEALKEQLSSPYFAELRHKEMVARLQYPGQIFPLPCEVFNWTQYCAIDDVDVVSLGQDPYPGVLPDGRPKAHGLAFSIRYPGKVMGGYPDALQNILAELKYCYPPQRNHPEFQHPEYGDLTGWAMQGVVLLNTLLTVHKGNANSHRGLGWEIFTDAVIERICARNTGVVFLLWGNVAKKKIEKLIREGRINEGNHHFLESSHPTARPGKEGAKPFRGCEHFLRTNELLQSQGKKPINWQKCNDFVEPHQVARWDHYLSTQPQPFIL